MPPSTPRAPLSRPSRRRQPAIPAEADSPLDAILASAIRRAPRWGRPRLAGGLAQRRAGVLCLDLSRRPQHGRRCAMSTATTHDPERNGTPPTNGQTENSMRPAALPVIAEAIPAELKKMRRHGWIGNTSRKLTTTRARSTGTSPRSAPRVASRAARTQRRGRALMRLWPPT